MPGAVAGRTRSDGRRSARHGQQKPGALIFRNADMAALVLESDDVVDKYRDTIFEKLMENMTQQASLVSSGMQFVLARATSSASRITRRISPKTSFLGASLDVRHGRGWLLAPRCRRRYRRGRADNRQFTSASSWRRLSEILSQRKLQCYAHLGDRRSLAAIPSPPVCPKP